MAAKLVHSALTLGLAAGMHCPGSPSHVHASAQVEATASASCASVKEEMLARVESPEWHDPHHGGTYKMLSADGMMLEFSRLTGDKKYTDKMTFTLSDDSDGRCSIQGCSESQVFSVADFSTNYCNLRNLFCGSAEGCKPVKNDFASSESKVHHSLGATSDPKACIAQETTALRKAAPSNDMVGTATDDALGCASSCPMDPQTLIPKPSCLLYNCTGKLSKCLFNSDCRHALTCAGSCTLPLTKTDDAPRFQAVTECMRVHCPGFPVKKTCAALHCAVAAEKCAIHSGCRNALQCFTGCNVVSGQGQGLFEHVLAAQVDQIEV
eukprot:TRINITY_DN2706_c0_g1_i1.p1 TRINITY_DN2706_c0_g1~~TRINITY_DN2706_c0_g1_i1.p1  ORF type:complete len:323 (-),score=64.00 TRINITY_DN2706_c0_g1_i1:73-1041(-)